MFCNAMKYYGANLCVKTSTNMDTNNIFQLLTIFAQNLTIFPQRAKSCPIQLCSTANIFCKAYKVQHVNLSANATTKMDADNIFLFLTIFVKNLNILPQNSKYLTYSALKHTANVFSNAMKYNGANICANSPTNIDTDNIFLFLRIFEQNLTILPQNSKLLTYTAWNKS